MNTLAVQDVESALAALERAKTIFARSGDAAVATKNDQTIFDKTSTYVAAVTQTTEAELPPELLKLAQEQQRRLEALVGIGSAWLRKQDDPWKNDTLEEMYRALPLLAYMGHSTPTIDATIESFGTAKLLLTELVGFAVDGGSGLDDFRAFLAGLQSDISNGITEMHRTYPAFLMSRVFKQEPQTKLLIARLDAYKIDFTFDSTIIKTSCSSHDEINIKFTYNSYKSEFRYNSLDDPEVKKHWDDFIRSSDMDDLDKAKKKFQKDDVKREQNPA